MAIETLYKRLTSCLVRDRFSFERRLKKLEQRMQTGKPSDQMLEALTLDIQASCAKFDRRKASIPTQAYDDDLPIVQRREEIAEAIRNHQVVVICGETGSGKTTQLPRICLDEGRGVAGLIAHTQPRRIAARAVATRLSEELNAPLGALAGYKVRFQETVRETALIKVLTDGMLLSELQNDKYLNQYDTIIIDEAHERSLNIDFLLGYLKGLLAKRPDLKLIVTSATIDPERFATHFDGAPIIEVSGRTYPVDVLYRPLDSLEDDNNEENNQLHGILEALKELNRLDAHGDVLIFMTGEREILDTAAVLSKQGYRNTEVLPLYARLSSSEQQKIFHRGDKRRIILSTNVAETSLTVPGIRFVIDPGLARINRYSYRSKVQRLPIEPISQASANQRKGRCGRVMDGVCVRLYSEEEFELRDEFTSPEILRTNLASVILRMKAIGFGDIEGFPFLEKPEPKYISDGYKLLEELGAVDEAHQLTSLGKRLAKFPIDPRIGRMLLAADRENSLQETLVIAAALSIQDPRERPLDKQQAADEAHGEFSDERSDFIALLKMWNAYQEVRASQSNSQTRKWCHKHFLAYMRMQEWQDVYQQLVLIAQEFSLSFNEQNASYEQIHRALLAGLLGNIGFQADKGEFLGARGIRYKVFPGSGLFRKQPKWLMAAELVETSQLFARVNAAIDPAWIEQIGAHIAKHEYFEPHWIKKTGHVVAYDRVTVYGLIVNPKRKLNYHRINEVEARDIFIRQALVHGELNKLAPCLQHNIRLAHELLILEDKSRRRDILVDDETQFAFYDSRLPAHVFSEVSFESWRKQAEAQDKTLLFMQRDDLMRDKALPVSQEQFPDALIVGDLELKLQYRFEPGHEDDGVTLSAPLFVLNQIQVSDVDWLVPGLRLEKLAALIKTLPKSLRKHFVPAPDFAKAALEASHTNEDALRIPVPRFLASFLSSISGVAVQESDFVVEQMERCLHMQIRVLDESGKEMAKSRSLKVLQENLAAQIRLSLSALSANDFDRQGVCEWDFEQLPEFVETKRQGVIIKAYPALVDEGESVALRLFPNLDAANAVMRTGFMRLCELSCKEQVKYLLRQMPHLQTMSLVYAPIGNIVDLQHDIIDATFLNVFCEQAFPRDRSSFQTLVSENRNLIVVRASEIADVVKTILEQYFEIRKLTTTTNDLALVGLIKDINAHLATLVYPGFVSRTPQQWLKHIPRYLQAVVARIEKFHMDPKRDGQWHALIQPYWQQWSDLNAIVVSEGASQGLSEFAQFRWMLEEYRVSVFAQELKTAISISQKRLEKQWAAVLAERDRRAA